MSDIVLAIVDEIKKLDRVDCSIGGNYCIAVRFDCAWICSLWIRGDKVTCDDDIVTDFVSFYVRGSFVCSVYVSDEHLFLDYASDILEYTGLRKSVVLSFG